MYKMLSIWSFIKRMWEDLISSGVAWDIIIEMEGYARYYGVGK